MTYDDEEAAQLIADALPTGMLNEQGLDVRCVHLANPLDDDDPGYPNQIMLSIENDSPIGFEVFRLTVEKVKIR